MHTLPAARLVGHDFLGNHIGELLFRQPASKPPATVKGSSSGSTVCPSDSKTVRRESIVSQHSALVAPSSRTHADGHDAPPSLDSLFGIGAKGSSACPTDRVASPIHSSEGSGSEPGSVESRSGSADADLNLHLSQLSLSHKKMTAGSGPTSPRMSFVTSFGAKNRSSGSRRGTSEASSASYFGVSSPHSSASMSPMEQPGSITWNIPFREQHHSFANAIEHNAWLDRNPSRQSQSSDAVSSQPSQPLTSQQRDQNAKSAKSIASTGAATINAKSQSFSEASQPVRQRFTRAATESTLELIIQRQQPLGSLGEVPAPSAVGLAPSKSFGATTSGLLGHRRKPSLVPKEGDERTFCFVDNGLSEVESNGSLAEDPLHSSTPLASVPERCASQSSVKSSPRSSYREVVEVQYSAHQRATSAGDGLSRCASTLSKQSMAISKPGTAETSPEHAKSASPGTPSARSTSANQSSAQAPAFVLKSSLPATQHGSSRPKRRLRIQPNTQSRQSLLEKTMEQQRQASDAAIASNANGVPTAEVQRPAPTARVSESKPMSTHNDTGDIKERYDPIAHDAEQRVFRIQTATPPADASAFPFIMSGEDRSKTKLPASHARTSDWAREQNLLTDSSLSFGQAAVDLESSCTSSLTPEASTMASAAGPQSLSRHDTAGNSSTSSGSESLMDAPDLLSPAGTELSTPELESPPEEAMLDSKYGLSKPAPQRRASPLSA
ncbi:hypothetical protein PHSY_003192 [Pseudozyma hubeiensis SY62]|uniref:Uncharacterized protein n=1 Tax=Pseudozyma hubeiensis (strain SY62) TaxID=1305764 RepID=R9P2Q5_PSEHS|nr:hypothetical protein PHSY_003192 [Pseudozyma hubeiensis SY62]GAC95616.1 hypothetical protein PHSY_003192 [Pseudozyma hubeiensis SY62]